MNNTSIKNIITNTLKSISPTRTPTRSRANSVLGSQEDEYAPPTAEQIQQRTRLIEQVLLDSGFVHDNNIEINKKIKKTSVMPS